MKKNIVPYTNNPNIMTWHKFKNKFNPTLYEVADYNT